MNKPNEQRDAARSRWENEGGSLSEPAVPSRSVEDDAAQAARTNVDATYQSSVRGEHRYPDKHQTQAEQAARDDRDVVKRRLRGGR